MRMYVRRLPALAAAGVTVAALATVFTGTGTANAAEPCTNNGGDKFYCKNVAGATVYDRPNTDKPVGTMNSTNSWFHCRTEHGAPIGGPHPNRWLWTKADNGQWGYMKDTDIYSNTDPLPTEIGNGIPQPC